MKTYTFDELIENNDVNYAEIVAKQLGISIDDVNNFIDVCGDMGNTNHDCYVKISAIVGKEKAEQFMKFIHVVDNDETDL